MLTKIVYHALLFYIKPPEGAFLDEFRLFQHYLDKGSKPAITIHGYYIVRPIVKRLPSIGLGPQRPTVEPLTWIKDAIKWGFRRDNFEQLRRGKALAIVTHSNIAGTLKLSPSFISALARTSFKDILSPGGRPTS